MHLPPLVQQASGSIVFCEIFQTFLLATSLHVVRAGEEFWRVENHIFVKTYNNFFMSQKAPDIFFRSSNI